mgnify:CR=1 FL=1
MAQPGCNDQWGGSLRCSQIARQCTRTHGTTKARRLAWTGTAGRQGCQPGSARRADARQRRVMQGVAPGLCGASCSLAAFHSRACTSLQPCATQGHCCKWARATSGPGQQRRPYRPALQRKHRCLPHSSHRLQPPSARLDCCSAGAAEAKGCPPDASFQIGLLVTFAWKWPVAHRPLASTAQVPYKVVLRVLGVVVLRAHGAKSRDAAQRKSRGPS